MLKAFLFFFFNRLRLTSPPTKYTQNTQRRNESSFSPPPAVRKTRIFFFLQVISLNSVSKSCSKPMHLSVSFILWLRFLTVIFLAECKCLKQNLIKKTKTKLYQRQKHRMPHKKMNVNGMLHWSLNLEAAIWSPLSTLRTFKLSENPKFQRINFIRVTTNLSKHHSIPTSSQALISIFFSHLFPQSAKKLPENNGL